MKPVWDELAQLIKRAQGRGLRSMNAEEVARLDRLYRLTTIHLGQLQTRSRNTTLIQNLNRLVAKAHSLIYVAPRQSLLMRIVHFYCTGFSRAVVRTGRYHLLALILTIAGGVAGYYIAQTDDFAAYALMMGDTMRQPGSSQEQLEAVLRSGRDRGEGDKFAFMATLLTHNTKVGFTAFTSGVMAGIPTLFVILFNGALLGAYTAVHVRHDAAAEWWAWILPHGVTEIGAIVLCGGAGFLLGMAVLRPGYRTRRESLAAAGREGVCIAMGVVPMFIAAGFIESFVRQSHWTTESRYLFAAMTALFWIGYFTLGYLIEREAILEKSDRASDFSR